MFTVSALYTLTVSNSAHALVATDLAQVPLFLVQSAEPLVMLNMSNDHQLFYKAYDDWSDIDGNLPGGDPDIETTYKHSIDYYGYFDSYKCYTHDGSRFVPALVVKSDPPDPDTDKYCPAGNNYWSGNFLNWASMARIDTVRKILFGGLRSTDNPSPADGTGGLTVLERAYLPNDAHSFAKYYEEASNGQMARLTPWSNSEITICNTTYADDGNSETRTEPPLLRVAAGNFALWAANERYQCHWKGNGEAEGGGIISTRDGQTQYFSTTATTR
jgi:type IV pilus assembly protein PilY1